MITLEQAKQLEYGDILLYDITNKDKSTKEYRLKVNGAVKTWKRDPDRVKIPVKYGLYQYGYVTNGTFEDGKHINLILANVRLPD